MRKRPPEQLVKREIFLMLRNAFRNRIKIWNNYAGGIYDPVSERFLKRNSFMDAHGVSDILGIISPEGKLLAIEVKTDDLKDMTGKHFSRKTYPTAQQEEFMRQINEHGGIAFVARSGDEAIEELTKRLAVKTTSEPSGL